MTKTGSAGRVLYDGECPLCLGLVDRFGPFISGLGFELGSLQEAGYPLDEMRVVTADGRVYGGADGVVHLVSRVWWGRPLASLTRLPGGMPLARRAYRFVAARRHCRGGACAR